MNTTCAVLVRGGLVSFWALHVDPDELGQGLAVCESASMHPLGTEDCRQ